MAAPPTPTGQGSKNEFHRTPLAEERDTEGAALTVRSNNRYCLGPAGDQKKRFLHTPSGDAFATRKRSATGSSSRVIGRVYFFDGIPSHVECVCLHFEDTL